jgi:hypothetical protein
MSVSDQDAIERRLRMAATALRIWRLLRSACLALSFGILALSLIALTDWWIRSDFWLIRWGLTLVSVGLLVGAFLRWIRPAWKNRVSTLQVAMWLERVDPERFGQDLVAGVGLAQDLNPKRQVKRETHEVRLAERGSLSAAATLSPLHQQIISQTWKQLRTFRPLTSIYWERLAFPILLLVVAVASISSIAARAPGTTGVAAMRLLHPSGNYRWPTRHELLFVDLETVVAANTEFEIEVIDRGSVSTPTFDWSGSRSI